MENNSGKSNGKLVAILICLISVVIILLVVIVLLLVLKKDDVPTETNQSSENISSSSRDTRYDLLVKDTQLKDKMSWVMAEMANYQSNNSGKVPSYEKEWNVFFSKYIYETDGYEFSGCDNRIGGTLAECVDPDSLTWEDNSGEIHIAVWAKCDDKGGVEYSEGQRDYAIYSVLSSGEIWCIDNR